MYFRWPFHLFALICASFCEKCFLISQILWNCAPRPRWEAHFRRTVFANIVCKIMFPYPNLHQNQHFSGGISALCCSKNDSFRRLSGKWPSWEAQSHITIDFACILNRIFIISRLIWLQFVKSALPVLVAKHSTFGEAITAWHEAFVGAISS